MNPPEPTPPTTRPKVLASVYACEPAGGSEEGCGWNYVLQLAKFADVWAVTRTYHRASIEAAMRSADMPNIRWNYYDFRWPQNWHRNKRFERLHYNLWQYLMYRHVALPLHRSVGFDLTHHLTWGQYWSASHLYRLPTRFVWGPVGGGESAPKSFWPTFSLTGKLYELARDSARQLGHCLPAVRAQARHAVLALAATPESAIEMTRLGAARVEILPNAALPSQDFERLSTIDPTRNQTFRIISIGRLLHWKGFHLGIQAVAHFLATHPQAEYWIIGTGPERDRLERLARDLGIADSVRFWGRIPRSEVLVRLAECRVMLHPSLHDSSGWVPLEAGAAGLPVVCLNLGGPGQLVSEQTGIKVAADSPAQAIVDLSAALSSLADDEQRYRQVSRAAREHIGSHFLWDCVGDYFAASEAYRPVDKRV